jgi:hypothetical protein
MVDRPIVQVGELPCAEDVLGGWKDTMFGLGFLAQATIGPNTGVNGFGLSPTGPASLSFIVGAGSIYSVETADATAYGVLGTDSTSIFKQGLLTAPVTLTVTPPVTSGFSQVFIVQVAYSDVDTGTTLVPFFNSANPSAPSSSTENTIRQGQAVIELKAGTAAPSGSQTTPAPDAGFTALWAITVSNGATTITSANWAQQSATPFSTPWFPNLESLSSLFQPTIQQTTFFVNNSIGSDTLFDGTSATILGNKGPWATIGHAISVISTFNLGGQTVTIQLATTGVSYSSPGTISAPSSGSLVIRGNTSSQSSINISGVGSASNGVMAVSGSGTVSLQGFTLENTGNVTNNIIVNDNATCNLQNITFLASGTITAATVFSGSGGQINFSTGNIFSISAANFMLCLAGRIVMQNSIAVGGSPVMSAATVSAGDGGIITVSSGAVWTGSSVSGPRFSASTNGVLDSGTGSPNTFWPGSSNGSAANGGVSV